MLLALDIGNSSISIGLFRGESLDVHRIDTLPQITLQGYEEALNEVLKGEEVHGVVVCSVVPSLTELVIQEAKGFFQKEPIIVAPDTAVDLLGFNVDDPAKMGADRIASSVAASKMFGPPVAVLDFGTATTVNFIGPGPVYNGGAILPGLSMMARSLSKDTALLPKVYLNRDSILDEIEPMGKDTGGNIFSGIIYGTAGAVANIIDAVESSEGISYKIVVTGGFMQHMMPFLKRADFKEPALVLKGLKIIYESHNER
jgi:type III pantothenate kinase